MNIDWIICNLWYTKRRKTQDVMYSMLCVLCGFRVTYDVLSTNPPIRVRYSDRGKNCILLEFSNGSQSFDARMIGHFKHVFVFTPNNRWYNFASGKKFLFYTSNHRTYRITRIHTYDEMNANVWYIIS